MLLNWHPKEEQIQELLRDITFFLIEDETEVAKQKYISVLVGSLDAPNQTFLVNCHPEPEPWPSG